MKTTLFRIFSGILLSLTISALVYADDVVVITNSGINISSVEVKDIFLGEKQFAGDVKLKPVDNAAVQKDFLSKYLDMDASKYNSIWTKKAFRDGLNPPPIKSSDADVIEYVKQTTGAIGYVSKGATGVNLVR